MDYKDKVVLVTGGANGIGKSVTLSYCIEGAVVIFCDNDCKSGKELEDYIKKHNFKGEFYDIDLENIDHIESMFKYIIDKYNKIDILINNAGVFTQKSIYDVTVRDWDKIININLRATFFCSKQFAIYNKGCSYGRIINISSTRYLMSENNTEAYSASKGGITSLTHSLALSLSNENITVNCISPGWIETKDYESLKEIDHIQHPSKRVGNPDDIARTCLFLTDEKNDFINGENIIIDGGMTKKMIYEY